MGKRLEQDGKGFLKVVDKTKVAVVGSEHFSEYRKFREVMDLELGGKGTRTIVTGNGQGVNALVRLYAIEYQFGLEVKERDQRIIDPVSYLIAFWDGSSRRTGLIIERAEKHLEEVTVHRVDTWDP